MNTTVNYTSLVSDKIDDLKSQIASLKTRNTEDKNAPDYISANTRGTQLYKLGRDRRVMHLIGSLVEQLGDKVKLTADDMDTFVLITTLSGERTERSSVEVNEGDSILELLQKYEDKKDLQKKLATACEKKGLKLDYATGKVVKA